MKEVKGLNVNIKEIKQDMAKFDDKIKDIGEIKKMDTPISDKKKILFVGDSLSRNLNLSVIKNVTNHEIKRVEASIIDKNDKKAKQPHKNFIETVPRELEAEQFTTLILQGGTNEITNLDVFGENVVTKIEALKEEAKESSTKLFKLAEESLAKNRNLEKFIIIKRIFRCDTLESDPNQLKLELSEYANRVLDDIWISKECPKNIQLVKQNLDCSGDLRFQRFGSPSNSGYDGIHMRGSMAIQHYTGSLIQCLLKVIPDCYPANNMQNNRKTDTQKYTPLFQQNQPRQFPKPKPVHRLDKVSYPNQYQHSMYTTTHSTPATGANRAPIGGQALYSVRTQNRFSQLSGN